MTYGTTQGKHESPFLRFYVPPRWPTRPLSWLPRPPVGHIDPSLALQTLQLAFQSLQLAFQTPQLAPQTLQLALKTSQLALQNPQTRNGETETHDCPVWYHRSLAPIGAAAPSRQPLTK